ncbi:hypothetical protein KAR29_11045 [Aminithiophilus ramosus]|uniref:B3/B4 tRNA-binding domain-containing protein n=2 Tax=Synergistales TaxID=649776 RepID=A0A9Q7A6H7_9BACT|nr:hypothetical protein [Aminithiophilus ramosus]QTX31860.1 hypothetical protein KAR29_11045 [Aminithiophilus ramosus]QVL35698.1 hypothetical protein KIH16_11055 [Synergistota bacterium]
MIAVTDAWKEAFPETSFGFLVMEGIGNASPSGEIERMTAERTEEVRRRHKGKTRKDIAKEAPFAAYEGYFRRFGQGYPVLHQVETVALKGRPIASPSPLVAILFMTELSSGLLSAGHDLENVTVPLILDVALGTEVYRAMGGRERQLQRGDMFLSDGKGILSSVLYGPDGESFIRPETSRALFTVYGAPGLAAEAIAAHLMAIRSAVALLDPGAGTTAMAVVP